MQQQYWVTKKSVLRKFGGKEDECIVSSDAELDAKLELFKSINESCIHLLRVIDLYQERLCNLAQEENTLGRYLKECGKHEKNINAGHILQTSGKALAYTGHQRLLVRLPLVRLHHEVETFRGQAITDTKNTVSEMEKARTEYRAALDWMKSASAELDPDTGSGLDRFRKSQAYVKNTKSKFDRLTLACLQKIDLLAAARCNMFSHALIPYQDAISLFSNKTVETFTTALKKIENITPFDLNTSIPELVTSFDKDKNTFFNAEYSDNEKGKDKEEGNKDISILLGEEFSAPNIEPINSFQSDATSKSNNELLDLSWAKTFDYLGSDFMPSKLNQHESLIKNEEHSKENTKNTKETKKNDENESQVSWSALFSDLDPLSNPEQVTNDRL